MCTEKFQNIRKLLNEVSEIANTPLVEAHNYGSVKQRVLHLELQSELHYLTKLIEEPRLFEERFKRRCQERFINEKEHLGIRQESLSATKDLLLDTNELVHFPLGSHCQFREQLLNRLTKIHFFSQYPNIN
ncbi:TPA: hypothetical protein JA361_14920 [Legionella pneumophila]|nr:hypothetical protein [Legionella pneumophila]HAT8182172.1 hypothetical protein [Legionella pneumophila]